MYFFTSMTFIIAILVALFQSCIDLHQRKSLLLGGRAVSHLKKILDRQCTIASKINVTPKGIYLLISKQHSILAVANLFSHNNISHLVTAVKFHYRVQQLF